MILYYQFQLAITVANLTSFIQIHVYKLGTIIQSSCEEGFDEDHFLKSNQRLKLHIILCMLHFLIILMIYQSKHSFLNKCKPLSIKFRKGFLCNSKNDSVSSINFNVYFLL